MAMGSNNIFSDCDLRSNLLDKIADLPAASWTYNVTANGLRKSARSMLGTACGKAAGGVHVEAIVKCRLCWRSLIHNDLRKSQDGARMNS